MLHVRAHFLVAVRAFQLDKGATADEFWPLWVNRKGLRNGVEREKRFPLIFPPWDIVERNVSLLGEAIRLVS
jgi:hypothetical protein